ncbi:MAG: hypothetical protein ACO1OG_11345 [Devosia sp.]
MVAVALLLALAPTAGYAQGVDPSSTQQVPGAAGIDRAAVEAQRAQLFQAMLADPSNIDLAFQYAALSEQLGDLEAAISTLERMLVFAPGLPRLQFELGVLYYRLASWNTAKSYFETVLAQPAVPEDIRTRIGTYMATIEQRTEAAISYGEVGVGVRYQTNANAGPATTSIELGGLPFELDEGALGTPDYNGYVTARYHHSIDLENQGDRFDIDFSGYGALYAEQTDLDTGIVDISLGPNFNLAAIGIDNGRLAVHGDFGAALLGGNPYLTSAGLGADLSLLLDARTRFTLSGDAVHEEYYDSDLRPSSSDRSGQTYSAGSGLQYLLTPDVTLFAAMDLNRTVARTDYYSNWQYGASGGVAILFGDAGTERVSLSLSGGVSRQLADAPDPAMLTDEAEDELVSYVSAGLAVPLMAGIVVQSNVTYSVSDSNYDISNYDNLAASLGLSKKF